MAEDKGDGGRAFTKAWREQEGGTPVTENPIQLRIREWGVGT